MTSPKSYHYLEKKIPVFRHPFRQGESRRSNITVFNYMRIGHHVRFNQSLSFDIFAFYAVGILYVFVISVFGTSVSIRSTLRALISESIFYSILRVRIYVFVPVCPVSQSEASLSLVSGPIRAFKAIQDIHQPLSITRLLQSLTPITHTITCTGDWKGAPRYHETKSRLNLT